MIFNVNENNLNNSVEKQPQASIFIINEVEIKKFDTGSIALNFVVTNQETQENCKFQMFVIGKDGKETFQKRNLDKIAFCAGIKGDLHSGKGKDDKEVLITLHNKQVGLMLNLVDEADQKDKDKIYTKYDFFEAFCPKTRRLSSEIKDGKDALLFDVFKEKLQHKELNKPKASMSKEQWDKQKQDYEPHEAFDNDEIPF